MFTCLINLISVKALFNCTFVVLQSIYSIYSKETQGFLSAFELREALNSAGYHINNHILNILAHRYAGKDGRISFDDFIMCAVKLKTMIGQSCSLLKKLKVIPMNFVYSITRAF